MMLAYVDSTEYKPCYTCVVNYLYGYVANTSLPNKEPVVRYLGNTNFVA